MPVDVHELAHTLRTPLTCIMGFATVLDEAWDRLSDEQRKSFVEKIVKHGAALTGMLDEMVATHGGS